MVERPTRVPRELSCGFSLTNFLMSAYSALSADTVADRAIAMAAMIRLMAGSCLVPADLSRDPIGRVQGRAAPGGITVLRAALVPRTRSSRSPCCKCDRELRVQRGTRIIELLVVLDSEVRLRTCREC